MLLRRCGFTSSALAACLWTGWLALAALVPETAGQVPGVVVVKDIMGDAYHSKNGEGWTPLREGDAIGLGDLVYTGPDSAADLYLGPDAGYIRMTEKSQVALEDSSVDASYQQTDLSLILRMGTVVGFSNRLTNASDYKIKMSHGVLGVAASQFRVDVRGFFVALRGTLVYAYPQADGSLKSEMIKSPPASYYTRGTGVQPAPDALVQEVLVQSTGALPRYSPLRKSKGKRPTVPSSPTGFEQESSETSP